MGIRDFSVSIATINAYFTRAGLDNAWLELEIPQVDVTGAGDCFTAAIAYGVATGQSIEDSVGFASATAAIAVSRLGAQPSFPTINEVQAFLDSHTLL